MLPLTTPILTLTPPPPLSCPHPSFHVFSPLHPHPPSHACTLPLMPTHLLASSPLAPSPSSHTHLPSHAHPPLSHSPSCNLALRLTPSLHSGGVWWGGGGLWDLGACQWWARLLVTCGLMSMCGVEGGGVGLWCWSSHGECKSSSAAVVESGVVM